MAETVANRPNSEERVSADTRSSESILRVEGLTRRFGELVACNRISFEVQRGMVFGIAGPNGAGKTTLFNCIAGAYGYAGRILFEGQDISHLRAHQICHRGIARTFQIPVLFQSMDVRQNVKVGAHFGRRGGGPEPAAIEQAIGFVGMGEKLARPISSLNLLERKLIMLAAALATHPRLLLLDEPMAGLSPSEIKTFVGLVRRTNGELGVTIVLIEHLMKVLIEVSQRLMILNNGERICIGPPRQVCGDGQVRSVYLGESHA